MRLLGATTVRNAADVIEAFVRHDLTLLDVLDGITIFITTERQLART